MFVAIHCNIIYTHTTLNSVESKLDIVMTYYVQSLPNGPFLIADHAHNI